MLRRLGGWLLVVVGVLMAVAGAAGAIFVGPDNAVRSGTRQLQSDGAAIVTGPGAIDWAGPTLRLEARSSAGPVFIGVGNEVDVADLVADVTRTQVDEITLPGGDLRTSQVPGSQDFLPDVESLDWWVEKSDGEVAVVVLTLPEQPMSIVVMNADGSSPVDVEVAAEVSIRGLFWGLLAIAVIGLGLLNLGALILIRGRAKRPGATVPARSEPEAAT